MQRVQINALKSDEWIVRAREDKTLRARVGLPSTEGEAEEETEAVKSRGSTHTLATGEPAFSSASSGSAEALSDLPAQASWAK